MIKVTFIGAGSTVFMKNILTDILFEKNFSNCEIVLQDIDDRRLKTSNLVAEKVAKSIGANPKIIIEKNQKKALSGADFVILMFQIGGYEPSTVIDFEIPAKYGLKQTIGDTLGIGGIMRGLRTVPALLSVAKDMNEVCPSAIMLQYVNPMAINCLALSKFAPELKYVGLCHSVQGTAEDLAKDIGEDIKNPLVMSAQVSIICLFILSLKKLILMEKKKIFILKFLKLEKKKHLVPIGMDARTKLDIKF